MVGSIGVDHSSMAVWIQDLKLRSASKGVWCAPVSMYLEPLQGSQSRHPGGMDVAYHQTSP